MNGLLALFLVMLIAGLLGGAVNGIKALNERLEASDQDSSRPSPRLNFLLHLLSGLCASLIVPLFLSLSSSDLTESIIVDGKVSQSKFLVFSGFCLLAALFSRSFIDTVSERVLRKVEQANQNAERAASKVESVLLEPPADDRTGNTAQQEVSESEGKLLLSMLDRYPLYRSTSGMEQSTSLPRATVDIALANLAQKQLAELVQNRGEPQWRLTSIGHAMSSRLKEKR
jgi:hypothetical protein